MYPMPGYALEAIAQSHTALTRIDVLWSGRFVRSLSVESGSVNTEAGRAVLRNLSASVSDSDWDLTTSELKRLLSAFESEVKVYRGVLAGGIPVWIPQGVFQLTQREDAGDGTVSITGQDRAIMYQGPMSGSVAISGGTAVEEAIRKLLITRNRGVRMVSWKTGFTCGPLLYAPDIDVWSEAQELAASVGGTLYHDRDGILIFGPLAPTNNRAVQRYWRGSGTTLLKAQRTEDSDTVHNVVVVQNSSGSIRVVVEDTDPNSATWASGRYGRRPITIVNPHISTVEQAQQVAASALVRELGLSEVVSATVVPHPALNVLDVVNINDPQASLVDRNAVVEGITLPLEAGGTMAISTRRSILTRDGQVLEAVPTLVTAA